MTSNGNLKKATVQVQNVKSANFNSNSKHSPTMSSQESHLLQLMARAQKDIEDLEDWIKIQDESSAMERDAIIRTFEAYKTQIKNMETKFSKELEKKTIENSIFVESNIRQRHNFKRECKDLILGIKQKKQCENQKLTELKKNHNFEDIPLKYPSIWRFQTGKIKLVYENEFGKFVIKDIPTKQIAKIMKPPTVTRYKGSIVKSHLLNFHATTIVSTGDGYVWLRCYYDNSIRVMNHHGGTLNYITINFHIYHFVLTGCGKILATDTKEKGIKEISTDGKLKVVAWTRPYAPLGLCLYSHGQIVVGLQGPPHTIRILAYSDTDKESRKIRDIEKDESAKSIFSRYVNRVIQNKNGDYIVLCGCKK